MIGGGEPDDLDLFGGVELGDFLDEGWCCGYRVNNN
jgi:hypothetical protein